LEGGPPIFRQDCTCPALLVDEGAGFPYGAVTRSGPPFQALPVPKTLAAGLFRVRSPLLTESRLMSVPPATEMFQFAGFASPPYEFRWRYPLRGGLPHSEIPGSPIARISPGLFAACRVLLRLSVPRHPPDALLYAQPRPAGQRPQTANCRRAQRPAPAPQHRTRPRRGPRMKTRSDTQRTRRSHGAPGHPPRSLLNSLFTPSNNTRPEQLLGPKTLVPQTPGARRHPTGGATLEGRCRRGRWWR
jgi:hypothetical protein